MFSRDEKFISWWKSFVKLSPLQSKYYNPICLAQRMPLKWPQEIALDVSDSVQAE